VNLAVNQTLGRTIITAGDLPVMLALSFGGDVPALPSCSSALSPARARRSSSRRDCGAAGERRRGRVLNGDDRAGMSCAAKLDAGIITLVDRRMTVSYENSKTIFQGIKDAGIKSVSALPETGSIVAGAERTDVTLIRSPKKRRPSARRGRALRRRAARGPDAKSRISLRSRHCVAIAALWPPLCMLIALRTLG
jgi:hypothetical protein